MVYWGKTLIQLIQILMIYLAYWINKIELKQTKSFYSI